MIALALIQVAVSVNLALADTVELESRPIDSAVWALEQSVTPVGCSPGLRLGKARLVLTVPDKQRFFRVRGLQAGRPGPWFDLAQLWVVALPNGPWTATGGVGGAADAFPVEAGSPPVILPVKP